MAITQTGSTQIFNMGTTNAGNVSTAITVPADAVLAVVVVSGFGAANFFSGGGMTFTKGGSQVAMTNAIGSTGDTSTGAFMGGLFYLAGIDTGTNKTLAYDWIGTGVATNAPLIAVLFFTGVDTTSPVRDAKCSQVGTAAKTSPTITAQTGDFILAATTFFTGGGAEGSVTTWTNCTETLDVTHNLNADMGLAANSAPTGNMTVGVSAGVTMNDGTIMGIALIPAADIPASFYMGYGIV